MASKRNGQQTPPEPTQTPRSRRARAYEASKTAQPVRKERKPLHIGTASIIGVFVLFLALAGWGTAMTFLLVFGDSLSSRLIAENSEMQDRYEESLNAYRAEISRLAGELEESGQLQSDVGQALRKIVRRQRDIEVRLQALGKLGEFVTGTSSRGSNFLLPDGSGGASEGGGQKPVSPPLPPVRDRRTSNEPAAGATEGRFAHIAVPPDPETQIVTANHVTDLPAGDAEPETGRLRLAQDLPEPPKAQPDMDRIVLRLEQRVSRAEQAQEVILASIVRRSEANVAGVRNALREIGVSADKLGAPGRGDGYFPAIVLSLSDQKSQFGQRIQRVRSNYLMMRRMRALVQAIPIFMPTPPNVRFSSPFGLRFHPVLHTSRLHAGVDMAAPPGTPIRATGSGVVLSAGPGGGYGNLIQINHGNGVVTRYAHLSRIDVTPGQPVSAGSHIGLSGNTGLSTGPHLHYETRVNGNPENPACFLIVGDRLANKTNVPFKCDKPPSWTKIKLKQEAEEEGDG